MKKTLFLNATNQNKSQAESQNGPLSMYLPSYSALLELVQFKNRTLNLQRRRGHLRKFHRQIEVERESTEPNAS